VLFCPALCCAVLSFRDAWLGAVLSFPVLSYPVLNVLSCAVVCAFCPVPALRYAAPCAILRCALLRRSGVTCCDARSHSGNSMGNANIEVGNCKFLEQYFPEDQYVMEAPGVFKLGEFSVQW
jgi:hypothetical protein